MRFKLKIWRQKNRSAEGNFEEYDFPDASPNMSFLEMIDVLNDRILEKGGEPIAFEHDCREGICGSCSLVINGKPHGPHRKVSTCQTYMRSFKDGETITIEPFRSKLFPVLKDLITDRSALDRIMQAGGFVSVDTGAAPDANAILVPHDKAEKAFDAAACIGCGACVAACPNSAAMLFVGAKVAHLGTLPQGQPERDKRALRMVECMDEEGFGNCSNHFECEAVCPKGISSDVIAMLNRDYIKACAKKALL